MAPGWIWGAAAVAVLAAAAAAQHAEVLLGGGEVVWYTSGDSWKNVYTFVYHVLHDDTAWHTEALGWPFGDHPALADAQPLISNLLRPLARAGWLGERGATFLVLALPIASIPVAGGCLFALLRRYALPAPWAAGWTVALGLLYPQLPRVQGHYALAYGWVLPLLVLLWWRSRDAGHGWRRALPLGVLLAGGGLVHPYYLGVGGAAVLSLVGAEVLLRSASLRGAATATLFGVLLPAVVVVGASRLSDVHDDRIAEPYGLRAYVTNPLALVADRDQPHWRWFEREVRRLRLPDAEGRAYLGLAPACGILVFLWRRRRWRARERELGRERFRGELAVWCAGALVMAFACGVPMALRGELFDALRERSGPLRQLRSLGRFAWGTYYLWAPLGAAVLTRALTRPRRGRVLVGLALTLTLCEGASYWSAHRYAGMGHFFLRERDAVAEAIGERAFEAVLPVPYYHVGSENFSLDDQYYTLYYSTNVALEAGLPSAGLYLSRTSFADAVRTVSIGRGGWVMPGVLAERGPYLLVAGKHFLASEPAAAARYDPLLAAGRLLYDGEWVALYAVTAAELCVALDAAALVAASRSFPRAVLDSLAVGARASSGEGWYRREGFDGLANAEGLGGGPGYALGERGGVIAEVPVPRSPSPDTPRLSFHVRLDDEGQIRGTYAVAYRGDGGASLGREESSVTTDWTELADGWALVDRPLALPPGARSVELSFAPALDARSPGVVLDEVLLRGGGVSVVQRTEGPWLLDGRQWSGPRGRGCD